jgi:CheY-like chemotaxis protein
MSEKTRPEAALATERRILIVEDEILVRMLIGEAIRDAGYRVAEAPDADAALAYLKSGKRVDLVLTDIHMPGSMSGLALAKSLETEYPEIKVILTSGSMPVSITQSIAPFLRKPYSIPEALALISHMLRQKPSNG